MTDDQLHALKCFIEAKVHHAMSPSFANAQYLKIEEERLDREMQFEGASCGDAQGLPVGPKAGSRPAAPSSRLVDPGEVDVSILLSEGGK